MIISDLEAALVALDPKLTPAVAEEELGIMEAWCADIYEPISW